LILDFFPEKKVEDGLVKKDELNTSLPDPNLEKIEIRDKINNLKDMFESEADFSAINQSIAEGELNDNVEESLYTNDEAVELLKLQDSLRGLRSSRGSFSNAKSNNAPSKFDSERDRLEQQRKNVALKREDPADIAFRNEMKMLDSVLNPEKYAKKEVVLVEPSNFKKRDVKEVINASNVQNPHFNTVSINQSFTPIEGLIDEDIKVTQGSRVRIKIQNDIIIDGISVPENSYIYSSVTGFSSQRIKLTVKSIAVKNMIYDVDLEVYDLDGIPGLYVPSSQLRDLTKELGSNGISGITQGQGQQQQQRNLMVDIAQDIARTTSRTISSIIKKNKAKLKYNTNVILINNNIK
jgi:conjugative transposon TraM protein